MSSEKTIRVTLVKSLIGRLKTHQSRFPSLILTLTLRPP